MPETSELVFYVNGRRIVERHPDPDATLAHYLRLSLGLTGTKIGCAVGGCGACTVMVSSFDCRSGVIRHAAVNACLVRLCSLHGEAVTTVEGIGSTRTGLHAVQERIANTHGSQCGYCTPGFVMSMYALLRNESPRGAAGVRPTMEQLETALAGNLCRCTGYRPIVDAFRVFTQDGGGSAGGCQMGKDCCKLQKNDVEKGAEKESKTALQPPYDPETQEVIFPSELQLKAEQMNAESLTFKSDHTVWHRPTNLNEVLRLKQEYPAARLIVGNTEIGVEVKSRNAYNSVLIAVTHVAELRGHQVTEDGLVIGASVTLSEMQDILSQIVKDQPEEKTRFFAAVVEMLKLVGGQQIRNVASIGGHIVAASAVSDLNPLFQAAGCSVTLMSMGGVTRVVVMDHSFFTGPRTTAISDEEVLVSITLPFTDVNTYVYANKQARTKSDDMASVTSAMLVQFQDGGFLTKNITLSFSGMALSTVMAVHTASELKGKPWDDELLSLGTKLITQELQLKPDAPGGMIAYRMSLAQGMFYKFYLGIRLMFERKYPHLYKTPTPARYESAVSKDPRPPSKGVQLYEQVDDHQQEVDAVGRPFPHLSSQLHATGEAVYTGDIPPFSGELQLVFVLSTVTHARIRNVDATEALAMEGVVDFITYRDVPGKNEKGFMAHDEEIFRTVEVTCEGQTIGAILADTQVNAQKAARAVKIEYEKLEAILTIEDAIKANSFIQIPERKMVKGSVVDGMATSDHVIEGTFAMNGQKHFYMETQTCVAVPKRENGEMEIFSATQHASGLQDEVSKTLNIDENRIVCRVKRLGGAFGGKESNAARVALPVAVAAYKHQRPVRCVLDRDEDMIITGGRHPFMAKYKVGFDKTGKILALEAHLYSNGGYSADLSMMILQQAMTHLDNCYRIPNALVTGHVCKTNLASNTAFRGFGSCQGMLIGENIIAQIAAELGVDSSVVRRLNLCDDGDVTLCNDVLDNCTVKGCWEEVVRSSDYERRKIVVDKFNGENRWKKRGICILPCKKTIGFGMFYDQSHALVNAYVDGSVLVSHGGIEMGQGLHTKMIQIASRVLEIPVTKIFISETSTSIIPNASPTAGSHTSDLSGMAVMNACQILKERLEPFKKMKPNGEWNDWVKMAYFNKVSLSAAGFFKLANFGYDWIKNVAENMHYYTYGAACSEVEIDCLTGEHVLLRTDIVMDVGKSLNPAIDIGQIEGAFIQGYGLFAVEQVKYSSEGLMRSKGPATYKIPTVFDIPIEFNVSLLKGASNPKAVYSSKGIGEPPLNLAVAVFFALREAVEAARAEEGLGKKFSLHSPATAEAIRLAISNETGHIYIV